MDNEKMYAENTPVDIVAKELAHARKVFSCGIPTPEPGDFAIGNPLFDLGMLYLCCCKDDEQFVRDVFHMSMDTAERFRYFFVKEYWGEDADHGQIENTIKPYAGLKTLLIERNTGVCFPQFHELLSDVLK